MSSSQNPFSHARNTTPHGGPFRSSGPWGGSPADMMDQPFTDEMRDLQARGKDPYAGDASDGSDLSPERLPGGGRMAPHHHHHHHHQHPHSQHHLSHHSHHHQHHRAASSRQPKEPFTKTERRDWAETVLDNPELLMMYAQSSGAVRSVSPSRLGVFYLSKIAPSISPVFLIIWPLAAFPCRPPLHENLLSYTWEQR